MSEREIAEIDCAASSPIVRLITAWCAPTTSRAMSLMRWSSSSCGRSAPMARAASASRLSCPGADAA